MSWHIFTKPSVQTVQQRYSVWRNSNLVYSYFNDYFCLFVCLDFFVPLKNFLLIRKRYHYLWKLQILTYARHSWPLRSECSLACHTYSDTGHPFIMVICEDPWHSHLLPSSGAVTSCFYDLGLSRLVFEHPTLLLTGQCSNRLSRQRQQWRQTTDMPRKE